MQRSNSIQRISILLATIIMKPLAELHSNGDVELMLSELNAHIPFIKSNFTGSFYFRTKDVDVLWNAVKDKLSICYPIENFDYGMREFAVYDNNGYLLQFGCEVEEI